MAREIALQNIKIMFNRILRTGNTKSPEVCFRKTAHLLGCNCARALFGQNWSSALKELSVKFNHKFSIIAECFQEQCSSIAVQKLRRSTQLFAFYNRLYGEKLIDSVGSSFFRRLQSKPLLLSLGATLFAWDQNSVSDEELDRVVDDMIHIQELVQKTKGTQPAIPCEWQKIIDKPHLVVWRKPLENSHLFQYKVYGSFDDVPARAFFNTQVDLDFWKQWDKLAIDIKIIDKHEESGSEVVHWKMKFPYPLYSRDYVYVRRYKVDPSRKIMAMSAHAISHPRCPEKEDVVRVVAYESQLVIIPHQDFDANGFEYVLTYYDDPQTTFPTIAYNWMASTGVPEFVEKLHKAAKMMHERTQRGYRPAYYQNQNQNNRAHFSMSQYA